MRWGMVEPVRFMRLQTVSAGFSVLATFVAGAGATAGLAAAAATGLGEAEGASAVVQADDNGQMEASPTSISPERIMIPLYRRGSGAPN